MARVESNSMFNDSDKKLYKNELFADAELVVGDETWPIHKSIEATTSKVDITDHDPKIVDLVLRYLYTGEVPNSDEVPSMRELIDLFIAADYFAIEGLMSRVAFKIQKHLEYLRYDVKPGRPLLTDKALEGFLDAARLAYTDNPGFEALRGPIESFIHSTNFLLLRDSRFMNELKKSSDFFAALMYQMLPREIQETMPEECASCHMKSSDPEYFAHIWVAKEFDLRCKACKSARGGSGRDAYIRLMDCTGGKLCNTCFLPSNQVTTADVLPNQLHTRTPSRKPNMSVEQRDDPLIMMRASGESLFKKDQFYDATLVVNGEKWPVHKIILCTRSEYFRKAFTGSFVEANTSEIIIDCHPTLAVDGVLHYLYSGFVAIDSFTTLDSAIDLFVAADYFGVGHVKNEACDIIHDRLKDLFELPDSHEQEKQLLSPSDRDSFFRAARLAYASAPTFEMMQSPIRQFLRETDFLLTLDTRFMQELKDIPELALVIIGMMADKLLFKGKKKFRTCSCCGIEVPEFAESWVACVRQVHVQHSKGHLVLRGICPGCTKIGE
ncbi:hypothetical protein PG996_006810 [Apiospora saccharicola]|uniref:BTB domain-containing protein n=1 Tax=Apiospora saccharicola TaxID=335842 RepID=A0ABR1VCN7_9PEZI